MDAVGGSADLDHPKPIKRSRLLVGEGWEEMRFFRALADHLKIADIQIEQCGGKHGLVPYIRTWPVRPGFWQLHSIGITRDADTSAQSAFESICNALAEIRLTPPESLGVPSPGRPKISVLILPHGRETGMLEDVCLESVRPDPSIECVAAYFDCLKREAGREPKVSKMSKAQIRVWLASMSEPDKHLGEAAECGYWPWDSPAFDSVKQFLLAL